MYVLMVQHHAYYGVSCRLIEDYEAETVRKRLGPGVKTKFDSIYLDYETWGAHTPDVEDDGCSIVLIPVSINGLFATDTGKIGAGFYVIEEILYGDLRRIGVRGAENG